MKQQKIVDCHVHSDFSDDCSMPMQNACQAACDAGLGGVTFTDHIEVDFPNPKYNYTFDFAQRSNHIDQIQRLFDGKLKILKGLELGFQPHIIKETEKIVRDNELDFVISSVHVVDKIDLSSGKFCENKTKQQAFRRYLEEIYLSVSTMQHYDIVGHIGYIRRYVPFADRSMSYADYADILDAILRCVIQSGKGIEINTSGYRYDLGSMIPDLDVVKRYKELGGQIITIGSDSHSKERLGEFFKKGLDVLCAAGFDYVTYFEKRKPIFVRLDNVI
jgi:histidinol-phosphatase (PHP family)